MTEDTWRSSAGASIGTGVGRREFIAVGSGVGAALLAGCTSDDPGGDETPTDDGSDGSGGGETANFRLLVSDAPADIDDFDRLDVTFSKARVFQGGDGEGGEEPEDDDAGTETEEAEGEETEGPETEELEETETEEAETPSETVEEDQQRGTDDTATENGTTTDGADGGQGGEAEETQTEDGESDHEDDDADEGDRGFYVLELDSPTVDLTKVVGDVAQPIFEGELEAGSYQKLELHVESTEGVVDGETVEVKVPSEKLQLTKPFEVRAGEALDFVFDINVVKRGNQASYILKPVISKSGVRGEDVEVEEVGEGDGREGEGDGEEGAGSDDGGDSDGSDDGSDAGQGGAGNGTGGDGNESAA